MSHREGTELTLTMIKMYGEQSDRRDSKRRPFLTSGKTVVIAAADTPLERGTVQLPKHDAASVIKCYISLPNARVYL